MKNYRTIPEEDIEHEKVCFTCPEGIEMWVRYITARGDAYRYDFIDWPTDLWNKTAAESLEYIAERFRDTKHEKEYYVSMLYLTKIIDAETLFVPWKDSPNFKAILAEKAHENNQGGTRVAPPRNAIKQSMICVEHRMVSVKMAGARI